MNLSDYEGKDDIDNTRHDELLKKYLLIGMCAGFRYDSLAGDFDKTCRSCDRRGWCGNINKGK